MRTTSIKMTSKDYTLTREAEVPIFISLRSLSNFLSKKSAPSAFILTQPTHKVFQNPILQLMTILMKLSGIFEDTLTTTRCHHLTNLLLRRSFPRGIPPAQLRGDDVHQHHNNDVHASVSYLPCPLGLPLLPLVACLVLLQLVPSV